VLRELTIHGFKSIRQETTIEFGRVNLFIGGNGVGKSNVLEAIGVLSACLGREITSDELNKKGVRLSVPTLFKAAFKNHKLRANFDLKAKWDSGINYDVSVSAGVLSEELNFHSEFLSLNGKKIIGRSPHGFTVPAIGKEIKIKEGEVRSTRGTWDVFQHLIPDAQKMALQAEFQKLSQFAIYSPQTAFLRGTEIENNSVKPVGLNGGGIAKSIFHNHGFPTKIETNGASSLGKVYGNTVTGLDTRLDRIYCNYAL
jgi:predicted ATPase